MIDVIGFWSTVTFCIVTPLWFFGHRITRGILSIAKKNAPELPREIRKRGCYSTWEVKLYPQWAHKLNRMCGGGLFDSGGYAILGFFAFFPTVTLVVGVVNPHHTVIGIVENLAFFSATLVGWATVIIASAVVGFIGISKGSRLIGLIQIQEMKEKM